MTVLLNTDCLETNRMLVSTRTSLIIVMCYGYDLLTASEARREATVGGVGGAVVQVVGSDSCCHTGDVLLQT